LARRHHEPAVGDLRRGQRAVARDTSTLLGRPVRTWASLTVICTLHAVDGGGLAFVDGFAAGTLLVMLIDTMVPDALRKAGRVAGLMATLGFAVSAFLASVS
jgi:zinc transporter ZupT